MSDALSPGAGQAQAYFGFGPAQLNPLAFPSLATGILPYGVGVPLFEGAMLSLTESLTDCASGPGYGAPNACDVGAGSDVANAQPLVTLNNVMMDADTVYLAAIWVQVSPADTAAYAYLDPTFSAPSGTFTYSPGIGSGVPESSTWAMMLLGFAGLASFGQRARRRAGGKLEPGGTYA